MSGGTKLTLKERLELVWSKRRPDRRTGVEQTADGLEGRTPSEAQFMSNLVHLTRESRPDSVDGWALLLPSHVHLPGLGDPGVVEALRLYALGAGGPIRGDTPGWENPRLHPAHRGVLEFDGRQVRGALPAPLDH